jgi:integrative and conjugative element protein (TIGR02256 family)
MINLWRKPTVSISIRGAAAKLMHVAAKEAEPYETGGLLMGWWDKNTIIIEGAITVNDPKATETSWVRHEDMAQQKLDDVRSGDHDEIVGYVGDWHCHPANFSASYTDICSLKKNSKQYNLPVVLIVRKPGDQLEFHAASKGKLCKIETID